MNAQSDEVFSAERLRNNWILPKPPAASPPHLRNQQIQHQYFALLQLIRDSYADISRLSVPIADLSSLIELCFPLDTAAPAADAAQKQAVIQQLQQLEELLWALALPGKGR